MSTERWETRVVRITDLFLDEENVRLELIDNITSQESLINDMFINQAAFELCRNIARNGFFQHELPIAIESSQKLITVEGNRRLAALKALFNPNITPSFTTRLLQLTKDNSLLPITDIEIKIAPDRESVLQLLASIHTTKSRKPWPTLRQAYFYYAQIISKSRTIEELIAEYPNVNIPRFIKMWEMHTVVRSLNYSTPEEAAKVANQSSFPISTFERIYDNSTFQKEFGVSFKQNGSVLIKADRASFESCLKRVVLDVANKVENSRTLNSPELIKIYLDKVDKPEAAVSRKSLSAGSFKPIELTKNTRTTKGLIPEDVKCELPNAAIERQLRELQKIDYSIFPNASHDLLRSFLECSLKAYFMHKGITVSHHGAFTYLKDALKCAETHFESECKHLVQPIKLLLAKAGNSDENYLVSHDYLNAINHNPNIFSTKEIVKTAWDHMESIIRFVLRA